MARSNRAASTRYSIAEARDRLPAIIHDVERGATIELARRGKPVAVLVSLAEHRRLSRRSTGFWAAVERFRRSVDLGALDLDGGVFAGTRDRSPGREVAW